MENTHNRTYVMLILPGRQAAWFFSVGSQEDKFLDITDVISLADYSSARQ